jgi:hypothetical protein
MIEILDKNDMSLVKDKDIKNYLKYALNRLSKDYSYPQLGYFVIVETTKEALQPMRLREHEIPSMLDESFYQSYLEVVEFSEDIVDILVLFDNEFGVNLIMQKSILPPYILERVKKYQI